MIWARCEALHDKLIIYDYNTKNREEQTIVIKDYPYSVVKSFVQYLYDDKIECSSNDLKYLQQMASIYNMDRLGMFKSLILILID